MPESMTRAEHLQWCKDRALAYLKPTKPVAAFEAGRAGGWKYRYPDGSLSREEVQPVSQQQLMDAWASMVSDLRKHPETAEHVGIQLGMMQMMGGHTPTAEQMRHLIEGFN